MKKVILFSIILSTLISSCIIDHETLTVFYVKNVSNHIVKLTVFNASIQRLGGNRDTTYLLTNNAEIKNDYVMKGKGEINFVLFPFGESADSAYILFEDSLKIIYRKNDSNPRNILNVKSYVGGKTKKNDELYEYKYSITEEDYKNAR